MKNKLSIYLIKEGTTENEILKQTYTPQEIEGKGKFYYERSNIIPPSWVKSFFGNQINGELLRVSSAKGVLVTKIIYNEMDVFFVLSFGTGRHMINEEVIEERFGLKTTLNIVDATSIRSIEKNNLGANPKLSKEQVGRASKVREFGFDIEQDLLKAVTGTSKRPEFGNIVSGADSLSVTVDTDIDTVSEFLKHCYERYLSNDYVDEFGWIDQLKEIKDKVVTEKLCSALIQQLNAKEFSKIWMAIPDVIDWSDVKGFKYANRRELSDDIEISIFVESFKTEINDINQLKTKYVVLNSASTDGELLSWSAYKCIYAEIEVANNHYVLNNGKWYKIETSFVDFINKSYNNIDIATIDMLNYNHANEGDYNESFVASDDTFLLMDKKEIMHGGGHSQIEFCDIYTKDKKMIHVKHYGGSSVLSHLFLQGLNSAEYLVSDIDFRKKLNKQLKSGWKLTDPTRRIKPSEFEIIYAIISNNDEERPNIPFFSKVSCKNAIKRLQSYGYNVSLKRIKSDK